MLVFKYNYAIVQPKYINKIYSDLAFY